MLYYIIRMWNGSDPVPFGPFSSDYSRNNRLRGMMNIPGASIHKFYELDVRKSDGTVRMREIQRVNHIDAVRHQIAKYI